MFSFISLCKACDPRDRSILAPGAIITVVATYQISAVSDKISSCFPLYICICVCRVWVFFIVNICIFLMFEGPKED